MRPTRLLAALLAAVLVLELAGCASRTAVPVLATEPKPDPGAVGLAIAPKPPASAFQRPGVVGSGEGAKEGAKAGAVAAFVPGLAFVQLALDVFQVSLASRDPTDWSPDLRLRVSMQGRLLRASDGVELGAWSWQHEGHKATFFEWGDDDAKLLRIELERAGLALAAQVIKDVY